LPNNLAVKKNQAGSANIRNPIRMPFAAKKILPYRGLGPGVKRALEKGPDSDFRDGREGCLFTAAVRRKGAGRPINRARSAVVVAQRMSSVSFRPAARSGL